MLHFRDPVKLKTKKIVFEDVYVARDSGTLEQLKELSSKRRAVEESVNESSNITEAIAIEISGGLTSPFQQDIQKVEQYLPLLENLIHHVDLVSNNRQIVQWTSRLKIRWSSTLSSQSFFQLMGPKFYQIDSLQFELGMVLFLYGAFLRERALEVLPADLVQSAALFRKAAGVYHYLANEVFPTIRTSAERTPECTSSVSNIMSFICLAEAQAVTIKRAEEKGNTGGLLAKLHYGVAQLLHEASVVLHSNSGECKDLSLRFVDFIASCKALHELTSQKHVADDLKTAGQVGAAIGVLRHALVSAKKNMPAEELWKSIFSQNIDNVADMLKKFENENEFVWREKIATDDELPLLEGKKIVNLIPYRPQRWERELMFKI